MQEQIYHKPETVNQVFYVINYIVTIDSQLNMTPANACICSTLNFNLEKKSNRMKQVKRKKVRKKLFLVVSPVVDKKNTIQK